MKTNKILQTSYLDILFENRNKLYGAYELRKNYNRRAAKAIGTIIILGMISIVLPLISGFSPDNTLNPPIHKKDSIVITMIDLTQKPKPQPKVQSTTKTATSRSKLPTKIIKPILEPEPPKTPTEPIAGLPSNTANTGIAGTIQTMPGGSNTTTTSMPSNTIDDKIYEGHDVVDLPEFPGGDEALMSYLSTHIKYPSRASSNDIEGKVVLSFVVNKVGEIDEIKIERSLGYGCDEEAIRVLNSMPKWKPGRNNGAPVKVYFNLPIVFELDRQ